MFGNQVVDAIQIVPDRVHGEKLDEFSSRGVDQILSSRSIESHHGIDFGVDSLGSSTPQIQAVQKLVLFQHAGDQAARGAAEDGCITHPLQRKVFHGGFLQALGQFHYDIFSYWFLALDGEIGQDSIVTHYSCNGSSVLGCNHLAKGHAEKPDAGIGLQAFQKPQDSLLGDIRIDQVQPHNVRRGAKVVNRFQTNSTKEIGGQKLERRVAGTNLQERIQGPLGKLFQPGERLHHANKL